MFGYSSHGHYTTLEEILELETERGNIHTQIAIKRFMILNPSSRYSKAIWVTYNPLQCAKEYLFGSDAYYMTNDIFIREYPEWESLLHSIDLQGLHIVCSDLQGGYLYTTLS